MNEKFDEAMSEYEKQVEADKKIVAELLFNADFLDDDGYPTEDALTIIEKWSWEDSTGWFEFIKSIWHLRSWGWSECEVIDEVTDKRGWCYYISTAGWSGNESIIRSMEKNDMLWALTWVQSRRGGHYIFQKKEFKDE